jgi:hypothetical protein
MGPLEQQIYDMTRADFPMTRADSPADGGSISTSEMLVMILGHFDKLERALLRLAAEVDGLGESAARPA